ncbi:CHAT domain-containing protein [Leptolyngbya sp. AN02str]|uniref:CHAT domain-containing protein n=1 Tax=Leptolyngbya sp. AN02str TaxID=3423363 RepID=UPI003D313132
MMNHRYRAGLGFVLGLVATLVLFAPVNASTEQVHIERAHTQHTHTKQAQTETSAPSQLTPISALRLDPQQLSTSLDEGRMAEAVLQLEQGWRQQLNEYYGRHFRTELLPPEQIAQSLQQINQTTGQRTALVYAVSTANQLEVVLLLPDGQLIHHRATEATEDAIAETIREFRAELVRPALPTQRYLPLAQRLYQWMLEPLESALEAQNIDNLIFCLGGGLRGVPLAALHNGQTFLIEQYGVSIIPAFNLLDRRPANLAGAQVLAMGASEFQTQVPLPAVPVELNAITQLWPGDVSLNQEFTLENLRNLRSRQPYSIVHLATHADFAPGDVEESYIQFWNQQLGLNQLRSLGLQSPTVELLVLSACRTAVGDPNAELGFAGLAVQSGAKSALASLWSIPDAGTFVFMTGFYQALMDAPTKGEALRQTQLAMLQGRLTLESESLQPVLRGLAIPEEVVQDAATNLAHPYYWSGFTLIGNPW